MSDSAGSAGLLGTTRNGAAALLAAGRARLELLGLELREEKLRVVDLLLLATTTAFCFLIAAILLVALLVIVFWDSRIVLLGALSGVFVSAGALAWRALGRSLSQSGPLFAQSIAELDKDLHQLGGLKRDEAATD
ncbi:phage holin family protein [Accumulibacter sp.]|uniref:phage holin family protein n=1 Tax=Accumulibacter sp. TaxID=2053492 RepID=UPI0025FE0F66|nr:phage holin family protein [Accumulibacter sp.]MCM8596060.1 phage holin family protein [Accumulibacter sp.]MCM8627039.1 phage holin family protein [Accumulibacter sp.]MDS4050209.1 phage holin family protein [Accumulibacter sp.]